VVAVVVGGLSWWCTAGDPQGVHPPAAHSGPGQTNPALNGGACLEDPDQLFGRRPVWRNHEHAASTLTLLSAVERIDQINPDQGTVTDRSAVLGQVFLPAQNLGEREPERVCRIRAQSLSGRCALCEHVFARPESDPGRGAFGSLRVMPILLMAGWTLMTQLVNWH
jgi:hypothetical protein